MAPAFRGIITSTVLSALVCGTFSARAYAVVLATPPCTDHVDLASQEGLVCVRAETEQSYALPLRARRPEHFHRSLIGAHWIHRPRFALHALAEYWGRRDGTAVYHREWRPEVLALQVGSPAQDPVYGSIGKQPAPFGIKQILPGSYTSQAHESDYWDTARFGAIVAIDNQHNFTAEFGFFGEPARKRKLRSADNTSAVLRVTWDSSAWHGTRYVLSALAHDQGERRWGFGILNSAPNGTTTIIEWIRRRWQPHGGPQPFSQLIRFQVLGPAQQKSRSFMIYDDLLRERKVFTIGQDVTLTRSFHLKLAMGYTKEETPKPRYYWSMVSGFGWTL